MVVNPGNSIFIIGSGTAGLLSALFFKKNFLSSNVTIVRSKEIGVVGVGESTTPIIVDFLKYLEIDLYDFFKKLASCHFFIGNQSGPFAWASALNVPRAVELLDILDRYHYINDSNYYEYFSYF